MKTVLCALLLAGLMAAQPARTPELLPTLREVFADIGTLLASADTGRVDVLSARLAECGDELRLLETLSAALSRGILVDLPPALREKPEPAGARPTTEAEETRLLEELRAEVKLTEARRQSMGLPDGLSRARQGSVLAQAAAGVTLEIPVPPASHAGTPAVAAQSADPEALGRALYAARDWAGALNAFTLVTQKTPEVNCLMARCLERLERWAEAKALYESTSNADPKGPWGDLARWMLRFGGQKSTVRSALAMPGGSK